MKRLRLEGDLHDPNSGPMWFPAPIYSVYSQSEATSTLSCFSGFDKGHSQPVTRRSSESSKLSEISGPPGAQCAKFSYGPIPTVGFKLLIYYIHSGRDCVFSNCQPNSIRAKIRILPERHLLLGGGGSKSPVSGTVECSKHR